MNRRERTRAVMSGFGLTVATCLLLVPLGEAVKCYHCYDSFNKVADNRLFGASYGEKLVRCDKNQNNWNTWECPARWPACILTYGKVADHYEVVRTCGENEFCSRYKPPLGVKVEYCAECNTTLCNDYQKQPDPPSGPEPLFTFNININLNVEKYARAIP